MATDYYKMGMGLGGAYFDGKEDKRQRDYQDEKRARETTEYDQRQAEYTRALGLQRKSDDAYANLDSVSAGVVDPGATGLSQPSAQMLSQGYGAAKGPQAVRDAAGDYTREANRMGLAPQHNAQAPVTSRKASDREMLDAEMGVATATRDRGYRESLQAKGKELDWNDGRLTHGKAWDAMTEEQRAEMVTKASLDANVPGSGTWVAGEGKRAGYMWYTPPGKDPVQLSAKEAKEVFILGNLASVNPERARKETEAASDKVRAVYGHLFDSQTKGVTANNTGQHYLDNAEHQRGTLAEQTRAHKATEARAASNAADARANAKSARRAPMNFVDEQGRLVLVDANSMPIDPKTGVYATPPGLRQMKQPQVLDDRQKLAYTAAMKEMAEMEPGGDVAGVFAKYGLNPQEFGVNDPVAELAKAIQAKQAAGATAKPPTAMPGRPAPSTQQKAYDDWQASKPSWFSQQTPTGAAREKAAEQAYLEALRNPTR